MYIDDRFYYTYWVKCNMISFFFSCLVSDKTQQSNYTKASERNESEKKENERKK